MYDELKKAAYLGVSKPPKCPHGQEYATMKKNTVSPLILPQPEPVSTESMLTQILKRGVGQIHAQAMRQTDDRNRGHALEAVSVGCAMVASVVK